jgi:hypothetical protein
MRGNWRILGLGEFFLALMEGSPLLFKILKYLDVLILGNLNRGLDGFAWIEGRRVEAGFL